MRLYKQEVLKMFSRFGFCCSATDDFDDVEEEFELGAIGRKD
jgi:hypothetical protein